MKTDLDRVLTSCNVVAYWLEHWTLICENPVSNPLTVISKLVHFCTCFLSCIKEYLAKDSGGFVNEQSAQ